MCYEFDEFYRRARETEEAHRRKPADDSRKEGKSSAPAKPAAPGKGVNEQEPVPA
jgi:hypothetical protein